MHVGAHVSISGSRVSSDTETPEYDDVRNAVDRQRNFGGNCGQIFTTSPQVWQQPEISDDAADGFRELTDQQTRRAVGDPLIISRQPLYAER